jgi:hypothetical protein
MAELATIATIASTVISAVGTIASGQAAAEAGEQAQRVAGWEAKQLEMKGKEELAEGQRKMEERRDAKEDALSALQARAAASGFSATDPSNLALADEIERYGSLQEQLELYGGSVGRRDAEFAAKGRRFEGAQAYDAGQAKKKASYFNAAGTILGGVSSMASKYGGSMTKPSYASGGGGRYEELLHGYG